MANRFSNITTASFDPLSMEEIMAVPLAKQAQHDALEAEADAYSSLQSKRLSQDAQAVDAELENLRGRSNEISEALLSSGVNRDIISKFKKLKRDKDIQFSQQGLIGNAASNYDAATKFINDLATKKEQQAGWSPQEAKMWAESQVASFAGTQGDNGTFNAFSGKGLATKVDEDKFMRDAINDIEEQISPIALHAVGVGGLPAFTQAFREGTVSSVDYNTVMGHLATQAQNNPDLLNSLKQTAFFTGEQTPTDIGHFEERVKVVNGKNVKESKWVTGNSRFGRKMSGLGLVSQYSRTKFNTKLVKDPIGLKLWEMGLEEKEALSLVNFSRGEMNQITVDNLDEIRNNISLAEGELDSFNKQIQNRTKQIIDNGGDPTQDRELQRLKSMYEKSSVNYKNASFRLDQVYRSADQNALNPNDKKVVEGKRFLEEHNGDPIAALKALGKEVDPEWLKAGYQRDEKNKAGILLMQHFGVDVNAYGGAGHGQLGFQNVINSVENKRTKAVKQYLATSPQAEHFTRLNAENSGKFATKIGRMNDLYTENFNPASAQLAYGNGLLADSSDIEDSIGESESGYEYKVELTDGWDDNGNKFNNVIVTNPDNGKVTSIQVIDNMNPTFQRQAAEQLMNGDFNQRKVAQNILAGMEYMPDIKRSGMTYGNDGDIPVPLSTASGKPLQVRWERVPGEDRDHFIASVGGEQLNNGQAIYGEKEMAIAIQNFVDSKKQQ